MLVIPDFLKMIWKICHSILDTNLLILIQFPVALVSLDFGTITRIFIDRILTININGFPDYYPVFNNASAN